MSAIYLIAGSYISTHRTLTVFTESGSNFNE